MNELPQSDRSWALPRAPWVMRMTWSNLLFAHWAIDPDQIAPLLPSGLTLDTRDGQAWVGVVPFLMQRTAPRWCPSLPLLSQFLELNVRTYVTCDGKPGVWFFSLDAASRVAVRVARATFNLPYMDATMSLSRESDGSRIYQSKRTHRGEPPATYEATYVCDGDFHRAEPGSFEHWLTARYCLYSSGRNGRLYRGEIDHPPWQLAPASYVERTNTMGQPYGFEFDGDPHLLVAKSVSVRAWMIRACSIS